MTENRDDIEVPVPSAEEQPTAVSSAPTEAPAEIHAEASAYDEDALASWHARGQERRTQRKRSAVSGIREAIAQWPTWQRWAFFVPMAVIVLVVLLAVVDIAVSAGRIHPGVVAAGVEIGGMSKEDAAAKLARTLPARMKDPVTVSFESTTWEVSASQIKAAPDSTGTAASAFTIGRSGGFVDRIADRAAAWFKPVDVAVPVTSDASATAEVIDGIAAKIDAAPVDAAVKIEGTEATIVPEVLGRAVDRTALETDILAALVNERKTVEAQVALVPVKVTQAGAQQALDDTKRMLSGPVKVTYESKTWEFSAAEIAKWIRFSVAASSGTTAASSTASESAETSPEAGYRLVAYISAAEASPTVTERVGEAGKPAVNASFKASGGTVVIVPSQDGVGPDVASLADTMTTVLKGGGERTVQLLTQRVKPDITTEDAKGMGIKERISTYTTTYAASNKPRVNNIHTLADAIDGALVPPGGTFSFNGTVGPRTAAKGYQEAPAIVNGVLVPQLGGGICQVGTTFFNAVFESGLPVVERHNHSLYISHYPKGRDATVSWGGPDFKFKNDTENWILVATGYSNSSLTISLYGTDPGYDVSSSTGPWTNIKAHGTKEVQDPALALGKRVIETSGTDGRTIIVKRTVKKNGAVIREDTFKSVYKAETEVVRVGTGPAPGTTPTTTP